jgi:hypothetical protein
LDGGIAHGFDFSIVPIGSISESAPTRANPPPTCVAKKCRKLAQKTPVCGTAEVKSDMVRFFISGRKGRKTQSGSGSKAFFFSAQVWRLNKWPLDFLRK